MGYENYYKLKIIGEVMSPILHCPVCKQQKEGKFCGECGVPLEEIQKPKDNKLIIRELKKFSDDCDYLLKEDGGTNQAGSGWTIEEDIEKFSKNYPTLVFQLDCDWDNGFGDGPPSRYFYKNGVKKQSKAKVVYDDPDLE